MVVGFFSSHRRSSGSAGPSYAIAMCSLGRLSYQRGMIGATLSK